MPAFFVLNRIFVFQYIPLPSVEVYFNSVCVQILQKYSKIRICHQLPELEFNPNNIIQVNKLSPRLCRRGTSFNFYFPTPLKRSGTFIMINITSTSKKSEETRNFTVLADKCLKSCRVYIYVIIIYIYIIYLSNL